MHSKGNHKENGKTNYRIGENICKQYSLQVTNLQNNSWDSISKDGHKIKTDISPKRNIQMTERLNIADDSVQFSSVARNANQNYNNISITSHQSEWPSSKILHTINAGKGVGKRKHSYTVDGNVNW